MGEPRETPLEQVKTQKNLHPLTGQAFQPGPHWWEASALTTVPRLVTKPVLAQLEVVATLPG